MEVRTAIAIHGCHLEAQNWEKIIHSRVSKGLLLARDCDARVIFSFSTGASSREGKTEARLIYEYAVTWAANIWDRDHLVRQALLEQNVWIDEVSQNTAEEVKRLGFLCQVHAIQSLYLVSSPWHILRCHKEALKSKRSGNFPGIEILAAASDEPFLSNELVVDNVVVIEPPHRGDDPMLGVRPAMHEVIPALFSLIPEARVSVLDMLNQRINRERRLSRMIRKRGKKQ